MPIIEHRNTINLYIQLRVGDGSGGTMNLTHEFNCKQMTIGQVATLLQRFSDVANEVEKESISTSSSR